MNEKSDWIKISNEYKTTNISQKALAEKYEIPYPTLRDRAHKEKWTEARKKFREKVVKKTNNAAVRKKVKAEVNRLGRVYSNADKLMEKLEQAIAELNTYMVTENERSKEVTYDSKIGKPKKEKITTKQKLKRQEGVVDRSAMRSIASTLKDIKDIAESELKLGNGGTAIKIELPEELKEWAE